ncbi:MAG: phage tail protein [Spirulina sp. SIO3F2]|nr:phage tail protein [Spirulina sp. SIO3F2]
MATTIDDIKSKYPLPSFYYQVTIGDEGSIAFSEVSGLSIEYETITYKHGLSYKEGNIYMPGLKGDVNLTLKKGIVKADDYLLSWIMSTNLNTVEKRDLTISLLNESGEPTVSWNVYDAFPKKLDAPSFNASSSEVAIESLDLIARDISVEYL